MKNIKCRNCFFYRNEWCEKIVDSPDPEEARDCAYFREMTNADKIRSMTDEELVRFLKKQPTVDAVPVVRCRECKHYDGKWLCKISGVPSRKPDDFCSYGKRKEGADNG